MPPDAGTNPEPSRECRPHFEFLQPFSHRLCHTDGLTGDPINWLTRPDLQDSQVLGGRDYGPAGVTPGFAAGFPLLQYALDWGDCAGRIIRTRAHVSVLKGWPRRADRAQALNLLQRYVAIGDTCIPPVTGYLITAEPFAGWTWEPKALRQWLDYVELDPSCEGFRTGLPAGEAMATAQAWLARAAPAWKLLTTETFPYNERQMLPLWILNATAGDLSAT